MIFFFKHLTQNTLNAPLHDERIIVYMICIFNAFLNEFVDIYYRHL